MPKPKRDFPEKMSKLRQSILSSARNALRRRNPREWLKDQHSALRVRVDNPHTKLERWVSGFKKWDDFYACSKALRERHVENKKAEALLKGKRFGFAAGRAERMEFDTRINAHQLEFDRVWNSKKRPLEEMHRFLFTDVLEAMKQEEKKLLAMLDSRFLRTT
jgi:hypothetical protein